MIVKLLTLFGVSKFKRRLQRLAQVYTCHNPKVLEISCTDPIGLILHGTILLG